MNRADTRAGSVFVTVQYLFHVIVEVRILSAEDIARFLAVSVRCSAREKQRRFSYPMLVSNEAKQMLVTTATDLVISLLSYGKILQQILAAIGLWRLFKIAWRIVLWIGPDCAFVIIGWPKSFTASVMIAVNAPASWRTFTCTCTCILSHLMTFFCNRCTFSHQIESKAHEGHIVIVEVSIIKALD